MSSDTVYSAVRDFLTDNWTATAIAWENEPFEKPEPPAPWIMVEVSGDAYDQASIGAGSPSANRWREEGMVWCHVFAPAGSGSLTARQHAAALADLFRGLELPGDIEFRRLSIGLGEPGDEDGNWWRISLSAEWIRG
jgi:hypothetical protein